MIMENKSQSARKLVVMSKSVRLKLRTCRITSDTNWEHAKQTKLWKIVESSSEEVNSRLKIDRLGKYPTVEEYRTGSQELDLRLKLICRYRGGNFGLWPDRFKDQSNISTWLKKVILAFRYFSFYFRKHSDFWFKTSSRSISEVKVLTH